MILGPHLLTRPTRCLGTMIERHPHTSVHSGCGHMIGADAILREMYPLVVLRKYIDVRTICRIVFRILRTISGSRGILRSPGQGIYPIAGKIRHRSCRLTCLRVVYSVPRSDLPFRRRLRSSWVPSPSNNTSSPCWCQVQPPSSVHIRTGPLPRIADESTSITMLGRRSVPHGDE